MSTKVKLIKHSISESGKSVATLECEYARIVHCENLTHRQFSRNSSSSRAIPSNKVIEQVEEFPFVPEVWTSNKKGMQGDIITDKDVIAEAEKLWNEARLSAIKTTKALSDLGIHKQLANRHIETHQHIKVLITATDFDNYFKLRIHDAAQHEINELATKIKNELDESVPELLKWNEWHLPYVETTRDEFCGRIYGGGLSIEEAKKVSVSCCAQISYRNTDMTIDKAERMYRSLLDIDNNSEVIHGSAFEHACRPMKIDKVHQSFAASEIVEKGVTHMNRDLSLSSGNLNGWIQLRHTL